jgi:hypothetical protein
MNHVTKSQVEVSVSLEELMKLLAEEVTEAEVEYCCQWAYFCAINDGVELC